MRTEAVDRSARYFTKVFGCAEDVGGDQTSPSFRRRWDSSGRTKDFPRQVDPAQSAAHPGAGLPGIHEGSSQDRLLAAVQRVTDWLEQVSMGPRGNHGDLGIHGNSFSPLHGTAGSAHRGTPVEACHLDAEGRAVAVCRRPAARIAASVRRPPRGCPNGPRPAGQA